MHTARTPITDLRHIAEAQDISAFQWSTACGPGTPAYQAAVQFITALAREGKRNRAHSLTKFVAAAFPGEIEPAVLVARLHFDVGEIAEAIAKLEAVGDAGNRSSTWIALRAACACTTRDEIAARKWARRYVDVVPGAFLSPKRTDLPLVGVVNFGPSLINRPQLPKFLHFRDNYISQLAHREPVRYRFCSVFADSDNAGKMQSSAPLPDVVVNNLVGGELLGDKGAISCVQGALGRWKPRPVINGPEKAVGTSRDKIYKSLKDTPGLLAPKTEYFVFEQADHKLARRIEAGFEYPVIVRAPFFQFGTQMYLAHSRAELIEHLQTLAPGCFVIQFIENQRRPGLYCKMRAFFVENALHMCRVDYMPKWKVHAAGLRSSKEGVEYFKDNKQLLDEEAAVCADPQKELGPNVMRSLYHIRSVVKLDCFGIDFDVTKDGDLLLFEANASMNFIGNKPQTLIRHPEHAEQAMIEDLYKMLDARIFSGSRSAAFR